MIKLFSLKQQKAEEEKAAAEGKTKATAGQIRMQKGERSPRVHPLATRALDAHLARRRSTCVAQT